MDKERFKTLTLSILVIISIILIQQLWFPSPINIFKIEGGTDKNGNTVIEERKNIICPKTVTVSFGAGDRKKNYYTNLSSDIDFVWEQSKNILRDYFLKDPEITLVEHDVYIQANTLKSIELEFGDNIPASLISSIFDSSDNRIVKNIKEIKNILIPAFNQGVIYIIDGSQNETYEVRFHNYESNTTLISFIDELEENAEYIRYHPISSLFDELEKSYTAVPINYTLTAKQIFVESEIDIKDEVALREQSKNFFGENFDFVKTIKETSGAVVYIYGYGEKSLRINNKGVLEYKEEIGRISNTDILTSLDTAVGFICENGGFPKHTYLSSIQTIEDGQNKGYRFLFGYRIGGLPIKFNTDKTKHPIEIEVYGDKIKTYYSLVREIMNMQEINSEQKILYFPNIIEKNIKHFKLQHPSNENEFGIKADEGEKILQVLKNIKEVKLVYFDTVERQRVQLLKPSWMIKVENCAYYFDGYTGKIINKHMLD